MFLFNGNPLTHWLMLFAAIATVGCNKPLKKSNRAEAPYPSYSPAIDSTSTTTATPTPTPTPTDLPFVCPKYPVVFAHGFMGGKRAGFFVDVIPHFKALNCTVFHAEVPAVAGVIARGKSLASQIEKILTDTGAAKVNIIAHSQGGLDARYAISALNLGAKVASLTTLSTPHRGTPVADFALKSSSSNFAKEALAVLGGLIGGIVNSTNLDSDTRAAIESLSTDYLKNVFNPAYTDVSGVYYQSWGARTGGASTDQTKLFLKPSQFFMQLLAGDNDGLVPVSSAQWGTFRGILDADHIDLIGLQLEDKKSTPSFRHLKFLEQTLAELAGKSI